MKHIEIIESLLQYLPKEDYDLGYKYFNKRELIDLLDLVKSSIVIGVKKSRRNKEESYDFSNLEKLALELDLYLSNMGYDDIIYH